MNSSAKANWAKIHALRAIYILRRRHIRKENGAASSSTVGAEQSPRPSGSKHGATGAGGDTAPLPHEESCTKTTSQGSRAAALAAGAGPAGAAKNLKHTAFEIKAIATAQGRLWPDFGTSCQAVLDLKCVNEMIHTQYLSQTGQHVELSAPMDDPHEVRQHGC